MRLFRPPFLAAALGALAVAAVGLGSPAPAAPKATSSPSPAPSSSATPEPPEVAIPRLEAVLKANPNDREATANLAGLYLRTGRPQQAYLLTQKLLGSGTKTAQIYYIDGFANQQLGRAPQALADFEQAANLDPTNVDVLSSLVSVYLTANRPADAERVAKRAMTFNKTDVNAIETYAGVLAAERKFTESREQYEAAAKLDPKSAHPLALEAQTYVDEGAVALGQSVLDRALAIEPSSQEALLGKARLTGQQHDVKNAIPLYDRLLALQTEPRDKVGVLIEEAKLYVGEKMTADAERVLTGAVQQYPTVAEGHIAYGDFLAQFKTDKAGAEREWTAALGANRDSPEALLRLGALYAEQKQSQKALDAYKRLTEVAGGDPRSWLALADSYQVNNQPDKAREAFKQSYTLQHTPDALLGLASVDYKTKHYDECAQVLEGLDRAVPAISKQNPNILYTLGQCQQRTNQPGKARATYVRLLSVVKPGTQAASEVKGLIAQLDRSAKPAPAATKAPAKK